MRTRVYTTLCCLTSLLALSNVPAQELGRESPCSVTTLGTRVSLQSPTFEFALDTADGLRAVGHAFELNAGRIIKSNPAARGRQG